MPDKVDDFNVFTVEDRQSVSYGLCIAGTAVVGAAVGRIAGLSGVLVGAAGGLLWGLLVCKQVSPVIERKLLSANEELTEGELLSLSVLSDKRPVSRQSPKPCTCSVRYARSQQTAGKRGWPARTPSYHRERQRLSCSGKGEGAQPERPAGTRSEGGLARTKPRSLGLITNPRIRSS